MLINKQDSENVCSSQIILKFSIKPMIERDTYKYLGIDKNIAYVGPIKKTKNSKGILPPNEKDIKFRTVLFQKSNSQ